MLIRDFEKNLSAEKILKRMEGQCVSAYEEDAQDLVDMVKEQNALHPGVCLRAVPVTDKQGNVIEAGGIRMESELFGENCRKGDLIYPCLMTVGQELTQFGETLDDPFLSFLLTHLMNLCLDDGLAEAARVVWEEQKGRKVLLIRPGVEGICNFSQEQVISLLGDERKELQVEVKENGLLSPAYSSAALLFAGKDEENTINFDSEEGRAALVQELNRIAGHL